MMAKRRVLQVLSALQQALIESNIREQVPQTYKVVYEGTRRVYVLPKDLMEPMPPRQLTIRTRHTRGAALNKGGLPPVARNPNRVYDAAKVTGFRYPGTNTKFGNLSGYYRDREAASGQGLAIKDVL